MPETVESLASYFEILDEALQCDSITKRIDTRENAIAFRHRLHRARSLDRRLAREAHEPGDDAYGKSIYDTLVVKQPRPSEDGKWEVEILNTPFGIPGLVEES